MASKYPTPQDYCDKILAEIRSSNLHYLVQESPYSVYLTLRKKFTQNVPKVFNSQISSDVNDSTKANLIEAEKELVAAKDTIEVLESKLKMAETELYRESKSFKIQLEKIKDENKLLRESIAKFNAEESKHNRASIDFRILSKSKKKKCTIFKSGWTIWLTQTKS